MGKRIFGRWILVCLVMSILCSTAAANGRKTGALEQKKTEISALRLMIIDKIDQGIEMRIFLRKRLKELQNEIEAEWNRIVFDPSEVPLENLRINYNLNLIQHLQAYIDRLDERIAYFQAGNERLKFYLQQIQDDIAIINTLKDMEIEYLIDGVDRVLHEFTPEVKKKIFDVFDINLKPIDQVWSEITTKQSGSLAPDNL